MSDDPTTVQSPLDQALDAATPDQPVRVRGPGWLADIETRQVGPVGVVIERLRVEGRHGDLAERASAVAEGLRPQGERLLPVEVDPGLGGAVLRTRPEDMQRGHFYEVGLDATGAELSRHRRTPGGRVREPFALTREELGRIVEGLGQVVGGKEEE